MLVKHVPDDMLYISFKRDHHPASGLPMMYIFPSDDYVSFNGRFFSAL